MSHPNRRNALALTAMLPTLAVPALAGNSVLLAAARSVDQAWQRLSAACDIRNIADTAMFEWRKQNPKPPVPSSSEEDLREGETRRDYAVRMVLRAFDGPSIEWQEFTKASEAWKARYEEAEHLNGVIRAEELQSAVCAELEGAIDALCKVRARTLEDLRCKARLAKMMDDDDAIIASLLDDLVRAA